MPCDRIYTTSVNLEVADRDLLFQALENLGYQPRRQSDGTLVFQTEQWRGGSITPAGVLRVAAVDAEAESRLIRQAYAVECVKHAAQTYGWRVQTKSPQQLHLTRRV